MTDAPKQDAGTPPASKTRTPWWRNQDFRGWFQIIVISLLIPVAGFVYSYFNQNYQRQLSNDQLHETDFENYLNRMSDLVLKSASTTPATPTPGTNGSTPPAIAIPATGETPAIVIGNDGAKVFFANVYTQDVLRELAGDETRKGTVLQTLFNLGLIGSSNPVVSLQGVNLEEIDLSDHKLPNINLNSVILKKANLDGAWLPNAKLSSADLTDANLTCANLSGADLAGTNLTGANLTNAVVSLAQLQQAHLLNTILPDGTSLTIDQSHMTSDQSKCS